MGCARSGKKLAHETQALGRKKFRLGDPPNPTKVCASEIANPSEPRTAHLLDLDCLQVKKSRAPPPFPCCNDRSFRSAVFVVNARFPLPNRYRHAPARGFGAPARCRAPCKGASIPVYQRNPIDLAKTRRFHPPRRTDRRAAESPTHGWVYVWMYVWIVSTHTRESLSVGGNRAWDARVHPGCAPSRAPLQAVSRSDE